MTPNLAPVPIAKVTNGTSERERDLAQACSRAVPTVADLREHLPDGRALARAAVAHDEEVRRLAIARDTRPAAKGFMEGSVVPALLFVDERNPVRQMHPQPFCAAQLRVELRRRRQLRAAQPAAMFPDHPPRPVLRHGHGQGHHEERRRVAERPRHVAPDVIVAEHPAARQSVQRTLVVHARRRLQRKRPTAPTGFC